MKHSACQVARLKPGFHCGRHSALGLQGSVQAPIRVAGCSFWHPHAPFPVGAGWVAALALLRPQSGARQRFCRNWTCKARCFRGSRQAVLLLETS